MEKTITFQLTIDEANLILQALGNLPFSQVYPIIGKINEQANQQLNEDLVQTPKPKSDPKA